MKRLILIPILCLGSVPANAWLQAGCNNQSYTASDIAQAIQNSPTANSTLKGAACAFGGAGMAESGGNTCERNSANFGVLQLNQGNLGGTSPDAYLNMSLQQQVDKWAESVGNSNTSGGYATLANAQASGQGIGGTQVTAGMMSACFQFGAAICKNDIAFMQANGGQCPTSSNGGININSLPRAQWGSASLDGNGQSICSWGGAIQNKINQAASTCSNCTPVDNSLPPIPAPGPADITLPV